MSSVLLPLVSPASASIALRMAATLPSTAPLEDTSEGTRKRADKYAVTSSATGTGTVTLFAGSEAVRRVYILSGTDGSVLGEVDAPKTSGRSDVSFTFSVGASIENYLYIEKTDRSPAVYRVTYTAA